MFRLFRLTLLFLILQNTASSAEQVSWIKGQWTGFRIVAPSQYPGAGEMRARDFLKESVRIDAEKIVLPDQSVCALQKPVKEVWQNDMYTFGSFGGDWADIGLYETTAGFQVTTWAVDCADDREHLNQLVGQPEQDVLLLDFGRVFTSLQR